MTAPSRTLRLADLIDALRTAAGADEGVDLDGEVLDVPFPDLGYDSLALLETAAEVQRRFGIVLADELVAEAGTPRRFLDLANNPT
ncbi:acyl carrier protein [Pseudonocardia ailaonensis]|uniref:Acyl carrier protein n=1 Tax=Pseudonocardia ailaonensis TaxID=367279 RepID=A0ABN2N4E4_9PSEU